jgi:hypothetical protein
VSLVAEKIEKRERLGTERLGTFPKFNGFENFKVFFENTTTTN